MQSEDLILLPPLARLVFHNPRPGTSTMHKNSTLVTHNGNMVIHRFFL